MRKGDLLALVVGLIIGCAAAALGNSIALTFACYGMGIYMGVKSRQ